MAIIVTEQVQNWRETEFVSVQAAAKIAGVSPASIYKAEATGKVKFRRLLGRTLVTTGSLIALLETAGTWQPSERGSAGRAKRVERARATWTV